MSKPGKSGIPRLMAAFDYSCKGLQAAWRYEEAFRIEAVLAVVFMPASFIIGSTISHQLLLFLSCSLVIIAELINTAIESVVDRVSGELHRLSGQAKDIGSAVVLVTLITFVVIWTYSAWAFFT